MLEHIEKLSLISLTFIVVGILFLLASAYIVYKNKLIQYYLIRYGKVKVDDKAESQNGYSGHLKVQLDYGEEKESEHLVKEYELEQQESESSYTVVEDNDSDVGEDETTALAKEEYIDETVPLSQIDESITEEVEEETTVLVGEEETTVLSQQTDSDDETSVLSKDSYPTDNYEYADDSGLDETSTIEIEAPYDGEDETTVLTEEPVKYADDSDLDETFVITDAEDELWIPKTTDFVIDYDKSFLVTHIDNN